MNLKKTALLATIVAAGMGTASIVNAATATAVWTGLVPSNTPDDELVITGQGGSTGDLSGMIIANADGTFESDPVVMEARANDAATPGAPAIPGDLVDAQWTVNDVAVRYDNKILSDAVTVVRINGTDVEMGGDAGTAQVISAQILQTKSLELADIENADIRASLTMMATKI
ncbi:hypothetical protein [Vibrio parahaemolyticus]|uniref:hypothetical protein n=1 Tax=Vibrio parahaemolyticus TaxID=670 RepID=UPI002362B164|nr:hypothetical protein [Vibrio parahaemolyticus]ELU8564351.1 hypothetical protein [Vibrio parahaemolyticus]MDF4745734.1 hypothetical protein [Vibrio parahaemolyticus]